MPAREIARSPKPGSILGVLLVVMVAPLGEPVLAAVDTCDTDGGTAVCRGPELTEYTYTLSSPGWGIQGTPPTVFRSAGEAIGHRQSDYMSLVALCSATPNMQAWGSDQVHWGPKPNFYMGEETQNAATVLWTFVIPLYGNPSCNDTTTSSEGVLRARTVSCKAPFSSNYVTQPTQTYCFRIPSSKDPAKDMGPPTCGKKRCDGGNPINFSLGNKYQVEEDYAGSGPLPHQTLALLQQLPRRQRKRICRAGPSGPEVAVAAQL